MMPSHLKTRLLTVIQLLLWLSLVLAMSKGVFAQEVIKLSSQVSQLTLTDNIVLLRDADAELSADEIKALDDRFVAAKFPFSGGYTKAAHWFRFQLQREQGATVDWLLTIAPGYTDSVRLFAGDGSQLALLDEVGDTIAARSRPLHETITPYSLRLSLADEQVHSFYLRMESGSTSALQLTLATPEATAIASANERFMSGIMIGSLLILLLYGLSVQTLSNNRAYWAAAIYIIGSLFIRGTISGIAAQYVLPDWPELVNVLAPTGTCMQASGLMAFFSLFYNTRINFPRLHYALVLVVLMSVLTFISIFFNVFVYFAPILILIVFIALVVIVYISWVGRKRQIPGAQYVFWGMVIYALLVTFSLLMINGLVPAYNLFVNAPQYGSLIFVGLMFHGLYVQHLQRLFDKQEAKAKMENAQNEIHREKTLRQNQSRFISMVSHEIKTPLTVIDSSIQMLSLQVDNLDERSSEKIERIHKSIHHLSELINNTLISENIDYTTLKPDPVILDCERVIEKMLASLTADEQRFQTDVVSGLSVQADSVLLEIVLNNLFSNALKYSPGESVIDVKADYVQVDGRPGTQISVSNASLSQYKPDIASWLTKYYRQPEQSNIQGFGLGLYLVDEIVRAHTGQTQVALVSEQAPWQVQISVWFPEVEDMD